MCQVKIPRKKLLIIVGGLTLIVGILFVGIMKLRGQGQSFKAFTLPYIQNFDDVTLRDWLSKSGVWTIRQSTLAQMTGGQDPAQIFQPLL